jgi:hypothetical protein
VYPGDQGNLNVWRPGRRPTAIGAAGGGGFHLGSDRAGRAWFALWDPGAAGLHTAYLSDADAEPITVPTPGSQPGVVDGAGGLVISVGGSMFRFEPGRDGWTSLGTGDAVSAASGRVLVRVCEGALACRFEVVDVASGRRREGPASRDVGGPFGESLSPSGELVAVWHADAPSVTPAEGVTVELTVVDLRGNEQHLGPAAFFGCFGLGCPAMVQWAPSGGWLFWLDGDYRVRAWRPGLGGEPLLVDVPETVRVRSGGPLSISVATVAEMRAATGAPG